MTDWIQSRIIHAPEIPFLFNENYELPIDFWYIVENDRTTYVCNAYPGKGLSNNDVNKIHCEIQKTLRKEFPQHNIFQSVSKD